MKANSEKTKQSKNDAPRTGRHFVRSIRFEPGTVARHASDLAGHCQRCPGSSYRGNCNGGGVPQVSLLV